MSKTFVLFAGLVLTILAYASPAHAEQLIFQLGDTEPDLGWGETYIASDEFDGTNEFRSQDTYMVDLEEGLPHIVSEPPFCGYLNDELRVDTPQATCQRVKLHWVMHGGRGKDCTLTVSRYGSESLQATFVRLADWNRKDWTEEGSQEEMNHVHTFDLGALQEWKEYAVWLTYAGGGEDNGFHLDSIALTCGEFEPGP